MAPVAGNGSLQIRYRILSCRLCEDCTLPVYRVPPRKEYRLHLTVWGERE